MNELHVAFNGFGKRLFLLFIWQVFDYTAIWWSKILNKYTMLKGGCCIWWGLKMLNASYWLSLYIFQFYWGIIDKEKLCMMYIMVWYLFTLWNGLNHINSFIIFLNIATVCVYVCVCMELLKTHLLDLRMQLNGWVDVKCWVYVKGPANNV